VELNRSHFQPAVEQSYSSIGIVFTTNKPNGLLFWWGQEAGAEFTGQDFIAAAVVDGYVEFDLSPPFNVCVCIGCPVGGWAVSVATPPPSYLPPVATAPPRSTGWIREPQLTLSEQSSNLPAGEGTTIECYSSDDSYPNVMWERADGAPFSDNVRVSTVGNIPL